MKILKLLVLAGMTFAPLAHAGNTSGGSTFNVVNPEYYDPQVSISPELLESFQRDLSELTEFDTQPNLNLETQNSLVVTPSFLDHGKSKALGQFVTPEGLQGFVIKTEDGLVHLLTPNTETAD